MEIDMYQLLLAKFIFRRTRVQTIQSMWEYFCDAGLLVPNKYDFSVLGDELELILEKLR